MTDLLMPKRKFLTGLFGLVAAPAIVKAANIMPVKVIEPKWFLHDGLAFQSMAHPIPVGCRQLTLDDYHTLGILNEKKFAQWENVFASRGENRKNTAPEKS